jgi:protein-tyrosine phosphatase
VVGPAVLPVTGPTPDGGVHVLVVCTANIARSPVAAALLAAGWRSAPGIRVSSAGLRARVGAPVDPTMAALASVPVQGTGARQLTPELVRSADLVLTMTAAQRAAVVGSVPAAVRRTFTLAELAALAALAVGSDVLPPGEPAQRLAGLLAAAPRLRPLRTPGADDDIEDPYGRDDVVQRQVAAALEQHTTALVRAVSPTPAV